MTLVLLLDSLPIIMTKTEIKMKIKQFCKKKLTPVVPLRLCHSRSDSLSGWRSFAVRFIVRMEVIRGQIHCQDGGHSRSDSLSGWRSFAVRFIVRMELLFIISGDLCLPAQTLID